MDVPHRDGKEISELLALLAGFPAMMPVGTSHSPQQQRAATPSPRSTISETSRPPADASYDGLVPNTHGAPMEYVATARTASPQNTVYERGMIWKAGTQSKEMRLRESQRTAEVGECTFVPSINSGPTPSPLPRVSTSRNTTPTKTRAGDRLFEDAQRKQANINEKAMKWMKDAMKDCTFQPHTHKNMWTDYISPRYLESPSRGPTRTQPEEGHPFRPSINSPRTRPTPYLQTPAFERLSRGKENESPMMHDAEANVPLGSVNSKAGSTAGSTTEWMAFLQRVAKSEAKRKEHIRHLAKQEEMKIRASPTITDKSQQIMGGKQKGTFMNRLEADLGRRRRRSLESASGPPIDRDFTFSPSITRDAQTHRSRSASELCYGDTARRRVLRERALQEKSQKEMQDCTFRPKIYARSANSKMPLGKHPELFGPWMKLYEERRQTFHQKALAERNQQEMQECSFRPAIHDSPSYAHNIASSMALARPKRTPEHVDHTFGYSKR